MKINIRLIYLYLFSFVGLLIVVIGSVQLVDLGMKTFIFKNADTYEYASPAMGPNGEKTIDERQAKAMMQREQQRNRERQLSNAIAMIVVGLPLYVYHWRTIQKEQE